MKIDTTEQFELLPRAPIVEAVIQVLARPETAWDENAISANLRPKLSEFESCSSRSNLQQQVTWGAGHPPMVSEANLGWHGLLCQSKDKRAQFASDGFLFSRLQPYQGWTQFFGEAMRLWHIYRETARPLEMQRIGLRFINKIQLPPRSVDFEKYIQPYPEAPFNLELPFVNFFHQDTLDVPEYPFAVMITRTIVPSVNVQAEGVGLVVDIDAFTKVPQEIKEGVLEQRLAELRWLKNKAFFGSITEDTLKLFR